MPYSVRDRWSGELITSCGPRVAPAQAFTVKSSTSYEAVYSFRTGKDSVSNLKPNPEDSYMPSGNIAERLNYRRKFIERQLAGILSGGKSSPSHFLLGDVGHEFAKAKVFVSATPSTFSYWNGSRMHDGTNALPRYLTVQQNSGISVLATPFVSMQNDVPLGLFSSGSTAYGLSKAQATSSASSMINTMNPLKKQASYAQALIELARGDVPSILTKLTTHLHLITRMKLDGIKSAADAVGSAYLNNVFGWTPILKDINAAVEILSGIEQLLYVSDSSRRSLDWVIREQAVTSTSIGGWKASGPFMDTPTTDTSGVMTGYSTPVWSLATGPTLSSLSTERITQRTTARFHTGLRPSAANNGFWDRGQELNRLMGTEFTIDLLWELTPWSWLVDWFSNIGSVIENLSSLGLTNTLLNYAYSTVRREASQLITVGPQSKTSGTGFYHHSGTTILWNSDQKIRRAASPFGFGFSLEALSGSQWAVLVALGLARSR